SYFQKTVTTTGTNTLSFKWKLSADASDKLVLTDTVNGNTVVLATLTGPTDGWVSTAVTLAAGTHIFKWTYDRTASSAGTPNNNAWVDEVLIQGAPVLGNALSYGNVYNSAVNLPGSI